MRDDESLSSAKRFKYMISILKYPNDIFICCFREFKFISMMKPSRVDVEFKQRTGGVLRVRLVFKLTIPLVYF